MTFKVSQATEQFFISHAGDFHPDPVGLNTFEELQKWQEANTWDGCMPIYKPTEEDLKKSPFRTVKGAMAFQAWHDRRHLKYNMHFSLNGEHWLALQHVDELLRLDVNPVDAIAVYFMVYGRNAYYYRNGHHAVEDVSEFIDEAFKDGVEVAARDRSPTVMLEFAQAEGLVKGFW